MKIEKTYPFVRIPDSFFDNSNLKLKLKPPKYHNPFPYKPGINNAFEFVFGINKSRLLKYELEKDKFNRVKVQYEKDLANYNKKIDELTIETYKSDLNLVGDKYYSFFKKNENYDFKIFENKIGIGERIFGQLLKRNFGEKVVTNKFIEGIGFPDFLLIYRFLDFRIIINIEIDEPYVAETGEAIHYTLDNNAKDSVDFTRDNLFQICGILVLRLSEEQVIKYPTQCIDYIKTLMSDITNFKFPYSISDHNLPLVKRWSKNEAIDMSNENFRQTYVENINIPSKFERGLSYKIEDLSGSWIDQDDFGKLFFCKDYVPNNYYDLTIHDIARLTKMNKKLERLVTYFAIVKLEKDILTLNFIILNGKYMPKEYRFKWVLKILTLTENTFQYKEVDKEKVYLAKKDRIQ